MNYREEFLKDPAYDDLPDVQRKMMADAICPYCGMMYGQFHHKDCPEVTGIFPKEEKTNE